MRALFSFGQYMKIVRRLILTLATIVCALVLALLSLSIVASIRFYSDRNPAVSAVPVATNSGTSLRLSGAERQSVAREFPAAYSRRKEQTYLTLAEWSQVYSYNEFGDFLARGGRQTDFPFVSAIGNFWSDYFLSLDKSKGEEFNWPYNFVSWVIGINLTVEYGVKFAYESTCGRLTQLIAGSDTEADRFIAKSWNSYAKTLYQATWYHYPYFADMRSIWTETGLFNKQFVRNAERKIAFSVSYLLKGTYVTIMAFERGAKGEPDIQHRSYQQSRVSGRWPHPCPEGVERQSLPYRNGTLRWVQDSVSEIT
jgi:hypothetical protein